MTTAPTPTGFTAPDALSTSLQKVLVELVALHVTLKQAHWTVCGPGFRSLHLALDDIVTDVHDTVDDADPTSADLLHVIIDSLEKNAWLIAAEGRR